MGKRQGETAECGLYLADSGVGHHFDSEVLPLVGSVFKLDMLGLLGHLCLHHAVSQTVVFSY